MASLLDSAPAIKQEPPDIHGDGIALLLEFTCCFCIMMLEAFCILDSSHALLMMLCYRDELSDGCYSGVLQTSWRR